jgi:hypothetical protein
MLIESNLLEMKDKIKCAVYNLYTNSLLGDLFY